MKDAISVVLWVETIRFEIIRTRLYPTNMAKGAVMDWSHSRLTNRWIRTARTTVTVTICWRKLVGTSMSQSMA